MDPRTALIPTVEAARAITGLYGVRVNQLTIRTRTWNTAWGWEGSIEGDLFIDPAASFTEDMVESMISITGGDPDNNGVFEILEVLDAWTLRYDNSLISPDAANGTLAWGIASSTAFVGDGEPTDSDLVLPKHYKIRNIEGEEVLSSAGQYLVDDIIVDGITPSNEAVPPVGYTVDQLAPPCPTTNVEVIYVITGLHAGEYTRVALRSFRAFRHTLVLRRRQTTP